MNDPHVEWLVYRLETAATLVFQKPEPREDDTSSFHLRLEDGGLTVTMKDHYASVEEARRGDDLHVEERQHEVVLLLASSSTRVALLLEQPGCARGGARSSRHVRPVQSDQKPEDALAALLERAERWKRERTLTVDVRTNLAAEEGRLVQKVERLIAAIEDGQPVGNALKERQAELDAVRARLAEPEPPVASEEDFHATLRDHSKPILGWHPSSEHGPDIAQPRAAMPRSASAGSRLRRPSPAGLSRETAP
jgi:hypothetical protein